MDRVIVQFGAIPQDTDILNTNRDAMVGLGVALKAILGAGTYVDGAACTPVGGNMQVQIGPGSFYALAGIDATSYGSIAADTTDQIIQQGILFGQTPFTLTAPGTVGQSRYYLIEAQFQQTDTNPQVLQYFNSANPSQPLNGPGGTGVPQNTTRSGVFALQLVAGTASASPTVPATDSGWTALYTVLVTYGQSVIVGGNIAVASGAPFLTAKAGNLITPYAGNPNGHVAGSAAVAGVSAPSLVWDLTDNILWACTTTGTTSTAVWTEIGASVNWPFWCGTSAGTANAQTLTTPSALQSFVNGTGIGWQVGVGLTNTGAATITVGSFGTFPLRKDGPTGPVALTGGELVAGNRVSGSFDGTVVHLTATEMGTAALANASSSTGVLSAVSGATTVGHVAVFSDIAGTLVDGGPPNAAGAPAYITGSTTVGPGRWLVDTSVAALTLTLSSSPSLGAAWEFIDASGSWAANNLTINTNGLTITPPAATAPQAGPLTCNVAGESFILWYNGSTLKVF